MSCIAQSDRLDPKPFRDWCEGLLLPDQREQPVAIGSLTGRISRALLADRMGMDDRRLYAWREENRWLDRDKLAEALHRAGYSIDAIYPDLPPSPAPPAKPGGDGPELGRGSLLSDEEVLALHRIHTEGGVAIRELARRIYRKVGYASWESAAHGIRRGFRRLGLEAQYRHPSTLLIRSGQCIDTNSEGERCEAFAVRGSDRCWPHANREIARQRIAKANEARRLKAAV